MEHINSLQFEVNENQVLTIFKRFKSFLINTLFIPSQRGIGINY